MKQGWEIKKLSEVWDIMNGGTPDTSVPKFGMAKIYGLPQI